MSRLGYYGDDSLARMIFEELKKRGLAKDSEDKVSIPMHPKVRSLPPLVVESASCSSTLYGRVSEND